MTKKPSTYKGSKSAGWHDGDKKASTEFGGSDGQAGVRGAGMPNPRNQDGGRCGPNNSGDFNSMPNGYRGGK